MKPQRALWCLVDQSDGVWNKFEVCLGSVNFPCLVAGSQAYNEWHNSIDESDGVWKKSEVCLRSVDFPCLVAGSSSLLTHGKIVYIVNWSEQDSMVLRYCSLLSSLL